MQTPCPEDATSAKGVSPSPSTGPTSSSDVLNPASGHAGTCAAGCPLARIPAPVWRELVRLPWRRRHPVLFWGGLLLLFVLTVAGVMGRHDDAGPLRGERLALVAVRGSIMDVQPLLDWIATIERRDDVRGVLLRVDSPGGGAAASQELYGALARLAARKPLVVSMGATAASGGLMVAMAGQKIFANASTVTGSIGVRMSIPQLQGLLGKLGLGQETLVTAPFKDAGSFLRPLSPADRAYFGQVLEDMHQQFVEIVAKGRNLPQQQAAALATGKIFTGREALNLGLVDELGGQDVALAHLAGLTNVPASRPLLKRPDGKSWLQKELGATLRGLLTGLLQTSGLAVPGLLSGEPGDALNEPADAAMPLFLYRL